MTNLETADMAKQSRNQEQAAAEFARQAERLGFQARQDEGDPLTAVEAKFVTAQDPVVKTSSGSRLPAVPIEQALMLNSLKDQAEGRDPAERPPIVAGIREAKDGTIHGARPSTPTVHAQNEGEEGGATLGHTCAPMMTSPLFPPLPTYGPPSLMRNLQCYLFRFSSAILSFCFLMVLLLGSAFTSIPLMFRHIWIRMQLKDPDARRPFYAEEQRRKAARRTAEAAWQRQRQSDSIKVNDTESDGSLSDNLQEDVFTSLEGGPDPLVSDAGYYARRVGLDLEDFEVQTEDGFTVGLWHIYNPREYTPAQPAHRLQRSATVFRDDFAARGKIHGASGNQYQDEQRRYPVLLMHGLLQNGGAYCCNDDDSLAFFLTKSGYDIWIGNNRCGMDPRHNLLKYGDPRMWSWNIRQMGVMDLPALISRVLEETGFEKLGLVCHSQGTTQTFVALAKEQRPDIGEKISVFCALAPAVYAGPLIRKMYFKFMQAISPAMFRLIFGIHSFIPFMMQMHASLPGRLYGSMGYRVFSFLFNWTDDRWEQDIRDRLFQFSPSYVSSESMRWWLGRECFARQKCILATRSESQLEDQEDEEEDTFNNVDDSRAKDPSDCQHEQHHHDEHGKYAWFDHRAPPFAFWIAGSDDLVDGRRLLRRFERGREPHVDLVHAKIIDEYEHLDVIWAMDSIEKIGKEVREVIWRTASPEARAICRTPLGCD